MILIDCIVKHHVMIYLESLFMCGGKMLRKTLLILTLVLSVGFTFTQPSNAGFFKKNKKSDKKSVPQTVKEQKSALVVEIYASWCPGCKNIEPTIDLLLKDHAEIEFVKLDVSTPSKAKESAKKAEDLKILEFYNANKSKTATIAVFVPSTTELVSVFQNNSDMEDYENALKQAKEKEQALKEAKT